MNFFVCQICELTQVYMYGMGYFYIMGGILSMGFVMQSVFLPVFHDLKLTSTYQVKSNVINACLKQSFVLVEVEINR